MVIIKTVTAQLNLLLNIEENISDITTSLVDIFEVPQIEAMAPMYVWPNRPVTMTFDLAVTNVANHDVGMSGEGLPLAVVAGLSPTDVFDPLTFVTLSVSATSTSGEGFMYGLALNKFCFCPWDLSI